MRQGLQDKHRGAEHRALKLKNACESAYSRLCLAMDTAERQLNRLPDFSKTACPAPQRSGISAFGGVRSLWSQKGEQPGPQGIEVQRTASASR